MTDTNEKQLRVVQQAMTLGKTTQDGQGMDEDTIDLMELFYRLLDGWKMILCLALVGAILAGALTVFVIKPEYRATATIYVVSREDSVINMSDLQLGSALTNDYAKVFNMWELHEMVISMLDLPYSYKAMRDRLTVTNDTNTRMLDISFSSGSPEEAADVANAYATVVCSFIEDRMMTSRPSIMSVARVPQNPVGPNKVRNVMLGMIIGFMLAAGIIVVRTLMDDKYKNEDDILKYTGLVVLASIPNDAEIEKKDKKQRREKA